MSSAGAADLDVEDLVELHGAQLAVYGGSTGLRDRGLLESLAGTVALPLTDVVRCFGR